MKMPTAALNTLQSSYCELHTYHRPHVSVSDVHHILPQEWGGQTVKGNLVHICVQSHRNVHELLLLYVKAKGKPAWELLKHYGALERALAAEGWRRHLR